jgi:hypothetical protein
VLLLSSLGFTPSSSIDEVTECLRPGGLLVLAEVAGDLRNLDGQFDVSSPILFTNFWRQYFTERGRHAAWPPTISISDISQVLAYLYDTKRLMLFQDTIHLWRAQASRQNFCDWIASAPGD